MSTSVSTGSEPIIELRLSIEGKMSRSESHPSNKNIAIKQEISIQSVFHTTDESDSMTRSDEEYIGAVEKHSPASTRDVAEEVGVTRQGADYRLRKLESEEKVRSERIGNSLAWFPSK